MLFRLSGLVTLTATSAGTLTRVVAMFRPTGLLVLRCASWVHISACRHLIDENGPAPPTPRSPSSMQDILHMRYLRRRHRRRRPLWYSSCGCAPGVGWKWLKVVGSG